MMLMMRLADSGGGGSTEGALGATVPVERRMDIGPRKQWCRRWRAMIKQCERAKTDRIVYRAI